MLQALTLTALVAHVLPGALAVPALAVVAVLLAESFGREVWWLWPTRAPAGERAPELRALEACHG